MSAFIDQHRNRTTAEGLKWGVEPICAVLAIAPATYYAAKTRTPSHRDVRDAWLSGEIHRVLRRPTMVSTMAHRRCGAS
jgi:putative transposase